VDVRDPRSGAVYPAGTPIPMTGFAREVLSALPDTNVASATNNHSTLQEFTADSDKAGGKIDVQASPALSLFGRYGFPRSEYLRPAEHPAAIGWRRQRRHLRAQPSVRRGHHMGAGSNLAPRSAVRLLVDRGGEESTSARHRQRARSVRPAGLPSDDRISGGLPTQVITGYSDLGRQATNPQWQYPTVYNPKINYTWTTGAHSFKSGYESSGSTPRCRTSTRSTAATRTTGQFSRPAGTASNNIYNLADFMLGLRAQYALSNVLVADLRRNMHFAYVQDDWRVGSRLTLNMGVRYEYSTPYWERNNVLSNFDPATNAMVLARDGSLYDRALIDPDKEQLRSPPGLRVHLAAGNGRPRRLWRQLRALQPGGWWRRPAHQRPSGRQCRRQPDGPDVAVVRARGTGLSRYAFNGGKSRYKALQARFEWRMARELTLNSSLTVSETKDNGAQSLENSNGNSPSPQDFRNMDANFGYSNYHQPYNSTTSFVWSLPFGQGRRWGSGASPVMEALIGGWQVAGINTVYAGEPVTFTYSPDATFVVSGIAQDFRGANNYRPNVTCAPMASSADRTISNWFNRACVVLPTDPSQPFGNAGRNSVRGPLFWQFDLAASKRFALGGQAAFEFRFEAFDLLNRTNFRAPNGNRSAAGFRTITSTFDPRQLQLGFKLLW
jgi:hypothetical protein